MHETYDIGIVGTGFSGLLAAIEILKYNKKSLVIFEKKESVGGVWRDNIYPGCACDVRASFYSIKREANPNWSRSFASQEEILAYLKNLINKYGLEEYIKFNCPVKSMNFDEVFGCWEVRGGEDIYQVKTMILATGPFSFPKIPEIIGRDLFLGNTFHSSSWKSDLKLTGKKVAVIGTGASGIQLIPHIADQAEKLYVFQRTPQWILPKFDYKNPTIKKKLYKKFPILQKLNRELNFWFHELIGTSFFRNKALHNLLTVVAKRKIISKIQDPETAKKMIPNYKLGCKRILLSDNYYSSFNLPNVQLVTDRILEISKDALHTDLSKFKVDVIVYATGFVVADLKDYILINGLKGKSLNTKWDQDGAEAFLGINVSGFPNLCFLLGPNSGLSHSSAIHVIESQMHYVVQYIDFIEKQRENAYLDLEESTQKTYNKSIQNKLRSTIWDSGCQSWYMNKQGKNTTIFPGLLRRFRKTTRHFNPEKYNVINSCP